MGQIPALFICYAKMCQTRSGWHNMHMYNQKVHVMLLLFDRFYRVVREHPRDDLLWYDAYVTVMQTGGTNLSLRCEGVSLFERHSRKHVWHAQWKQPMLFMISREFVFRSGPFYSKFATFVANFILGHQLHSPKTCDG